MTEGEISACLVKHNELRRMASCFFSPPSKERRKKKSPLSFSFFFFFLTEWQPRQRRRCFAPKKERRKKRGHTQQQTTSTLFLAILFWHSVAHFLGQYARRPPERKKTLPTALPSSSFPSVAPSCLAKSLLLTRERKRGFPSLSRPLPFIGTDRQSGGDIRTTATVFQLKVSKILKYKKKTFGQNLRKDKQVRQSRDLQQGSRKGDTVLPIVWDSRPTKGKDNRCLIFLLSFSRTMISPPPPLPFCRPSV